MALRTEDAVKVVTDAYRTYGEYVNSVRSLPRKEDGLKIVQRRLLLAARDSGASNGTVKSASVVGNTLATYHPHGDASAYAALVSLVNRQHPMFIGQGNFGYYKGLTTTGPAAHRYTGVALTKLGQSMLEYRKVAPQFENDIDHQEPVYLPIPVPYALLTGTSGIGVGVTCFIPPITPKSLRQFIKAYLIDGDDSTILYPAPLGGGWIKMDAENVQLLNETGSASAQIGADVKWEWDPVEQKSGIVITSVPERVSPQRIKAALKQELDQKLVFLRDESDSNTRIVIHRYERVRRISDEELELRVRSAMTKWIRFSCFVSDGRRAVLIGVKEWLKASIDCALAAYSSTLNNEIHKFELDRKFFKLRKQLADALIIQDSSPELIKEEFSLTQEELDHFMSKTVRQLSSADNPIHKIEAQILDITMKLSNLKSSYYSGASIVGSI